MLLGLAMTSSGQTITTTNNLVFGLVYPGQPKQILPTAVGEAGEWLIAGNEGDEVRITFTTLPTYLNLNGVNVSVVISETDAALDTAAVPNQTSPPVSGLDPWQPIIYRLGANGLTLWLGGSIIPRQAQAEGDYSNLIQVQVEYTGN